MADFGNLLDKYIQETISESELKEFLIQVQKPKNQEILKQSIAQMVASNNYQDLSENINVDVLFNQVLDRAGRQTVDFQEAPVHRIHFLRTAWFRYAAAVIMIFSIGAYLWNLQDRVTPALTETQQSYPVNKDVAPGGNRAILTLADGTTINLDEALSGTIAKEGTATIEKTAEGQIRYRNVTNGLPQDIAVNTMSTPRGGQYMLILPDGSRVWLNAASSITYPNVFAGKQRKVSITGEAYFEVAKNTKQPFIVQVNGLEVKVLGTHFNVNAYPEESAMLTTLLKGSVQVQMNAAMKKLTAGQQAVGTVKGLEVNEKVDLEQVIAWKNGLFNFNETDLPTAMRQIARWYDLKVQFEGGVPDKEIRGKMGRDLNLSQVLRVLEKMEMKFRLEGRTLIVSP